MLPDRLNPRLWLRDWLNKPTAAEATAASYRFNGQVPIAAYSLQTIRDCTGRISVCGFGVSCDNGPFVVGPDGVRIQQPEDK
ncbi:hypothetical protein [Xanthomonas floridensis]|uniref:Uncharacterized protein n=1 Tax=Xanthomonas floridensis TaxID=1843580 RepID=A0A1A9MBW8_9XANT|nr:hypothetical protein [Xanthomonas floridensis]MEA5123277.1 hypothetical protein [Xanthomonas floridensis]MEA5132756.1 hypothetical protein [Xanthomonas floridensis]OAG67678.1 hypothetical protein A7D17_15935 [Xanthomonas floridensis]